MNWAVLLEIISRQLSNEAIGCPLSLHTSLVRLAQVRRRPAPGLILRADRMWRPVPSGVDDQYTPGVRRRGGTRGRCWRRSNCRPATSWNVRVQRWAVDAALSRDIGPGGWNRLSNRT